MFCRDKSMLVATKDVFCREQIILVADPANNRVLPRSSRHLVEEIMNSKFIKQFMAAGALNSSVHQGTALTSGTEDVCTLRHHSKQSSSVGRVSSAMKDLRYTPGYLRKSFCRPLCAHSEEKINLFLHVVLLVIEHVM